MSTEEVSSTQPPGGQMQEPQEHMMQAPQAHMMQGGHHYIQTNEVRNCIIHYYRAPDGTITEAGRIFTGGAGSGPYKPVSDQESAPNAFEGANSVIMTPDRRFLFATNGGDNSVSSFAVGVDGWAPVDGGYRPRATRAVRLAAEYGFKTERQTRRSAGR